MVWVKAKVLGYLASMSEIAGLEARTRAAIWESLSPAKLVEVFFELAVVRGRGLGHGAARFVDGCMKVQYRSRG